MLQRGKPPFLECSSNGDKRFSAFYACIKGRNGATIEQIYQGAKVFSDGSTGLHWKEAKGRKPANCIEVTNLYYLLWVEYLDENPYLLDILKEQSGLQDIYGIEGNQCQADILWRIINKANN